MTKSFLKKALTVVGAALLALPLALNANVVSAADEGETPAPKTTQKVTLTKFGFTTPQDAGAHDPATEWTEGAGEPVEGIKFDVYDITKDYWENITKFDEAGNATKEELSQAAADHYKAIDKDTMPASAVKVEIDADKSVTDKDGQINLELPIYSSDRSNAVYLFVEDADSAKAHGYTPDQNFVLALPVQNKDGVTVENAYVYPKNTNVGNHNLKFTKVDANNVKTVLAGAVFKIQNAANEYARVAGHAGEGNELEGYTNSNVDVTWVTDPSQATLFKSNDNGEFGFAAVEEYTDSKGVVHGLHEADDYTYTEVTAPAGYEKLPDTPVTADTDGENTVKNTPKGLLPHTGGAGIVAFVVLGAALLTFGIVAYNKRRASF